MMSSEIHMRDGVRAFGSASRWAVRVPDAASAALGAGEFDYTFTDKELDDVLGFMERQQGRAPGEPYPSPPPALAPLLGTTAHLAPLQFQVRVAGVFCCGRMPEIMLLIGEI